MKTQIIGKSNIKASRLILGCMRMEDKSIEEARDIIQKAYDLGINHFDHADIYGGGKSEEIFAEALKLTNIKREDIIIQSKCGIRKGFYDFSYDYIINSVENILKRLDTDYLDILLLHRPDTLMEPEEVSKAFSYLYEIGKVRNFGVSNCNLGQIKLLQKYSKFPILIDQLQFGPAHTPMIDSGINVNMKNINSINHEDGILEYCRLEDITIQAWSPFQVDLDQGLFVKHTDYIDLTKKLNEFAEEKNVTLESIVTAWILRHPAKMQMVVGSMNPNRLENIVAGVDIELTKEEWYEIYRSAGNDLP